MQGEHPVGTKRQFQVGCGTGVVRRGFRALDGQRYRLRPSGEKHRGRPLPVDGGTRLDGTLSRRGGAGVVGIFRRHLPGSFVDREAEDCLASVGCRMG